MDVHEALKRIPKTELHLHLEGTVATGTLAELAAKHDVILPPHDDPADLYSYDSLAEFLVVYDAVSNTVRDRDDFRRITYECLSRCSGDGARYVELFFSPEAHLGVGIDYLTVLDGVIQGQKDAKHDCGVESSLVPAINRELGPNRAVEFVNMVLEHRKPEIIGIAMDFNEVGFPPEDYVEAFRIAADNGLHRTSHQGEVGPAANVKNAIELLGCERIDHGYAVVEDPLLLQACADSQIGFTVCPTTTAFTTPWQDLTADNHAIRLMAQAGLKMMINSDDPPMLSTDLSNEYRLLHVVMGFGLGEIKEFALNGIDISWLDEDTKKRWRRDWSAEIDELFAELET